MSPKSSRCPFDLLLQALIVVWGPRSKFMEITKFAVPENNIWGRGSLNYAGLCARRLGAKKVFLVSDEGIENAGWLQRLMDILEKEGIEWVYYPGSNFQSARLPG